MEGDVQLIDKKKNERVKISNIEDLKMLFNAEDYFIEDFSGESTIDFITKNFKINENIFKDFLKSIYDKKITFKIKDVYELMDYIHKIKIFDDEARKLQKIISKVKILKIERIEYERKECTRDNIKEIIKDIQKTSKEVSELMETGGKTKLQKLEEEINHKYLYGKDIELLKRILIPNSKEVIEKYDEDTKIKTIIIKVPRKIIYKEERFKKGTVEYYEFLVSNIPRLRRLIKNINKYLTKEKEGWKTFKINQSEVLQDSINIAIATFNKKEFKAISGSNEIEGYCITPLEEETAFKSIKVNRLGQVGIGYNRKFDSEKKIMEKIHKKICNKSLKNEGTLILYSKWEPCLSCYYVINQFSKIHPSIKVKVKYFIEYGSDKR